MPTVEEVLRQSGFTNEQIAALDQRAVTAFSGVLTEATKAQSAAEQQRAEAKAAQDAAELAQRSNVDFYENRIAPSLTAWEEEKQRLENDRAKANAEAAFYRVQAEEAKKTGFIPAEAPGFDPAKFAPPANGNGQVRDPNSGRYVAGVPGATPGSPTFNVNEFAAKAGDAMGIIADINWNYQTLFGKPLPVSPTELIRKADEQKLDPMTYASRIFNFDARRQELQKQEQEARDQKLREEAIAPYEQKLKEKDEESKKALANKDREWAERTGNNPDIRRPQDNAQMSSIAKAAKTDPANFDPLLLNDQQRRSLTAQMIRKDMEANTAA
jgi:hypothetical protein